MIGIVIEGIKLLKTFYDIKDQLNENNTTGRRLCERLIIFEKFLQKLEAKLIHDLRFYENNENETSFEASVRCLVNLLKEMKEYLEKFLKKGSMYGNTKRFVLSVAYRNDISKDYASFNQRITDCVNNLMPNLEIDFEEQRRLDMESLHNQVEKMSNEVVEELFGLENNHTELKIYLAEMWEAVNQNTVALKENQREFQHYLTDFNTISEENANMKDLILTRIVELEKKIELKRHFNLEGVEQAIYAEQERIQSLIMENFHSYTASLNDVKELINILQNNADKTDDTLIQHLVVIHKKMERLSSLNMKELNELKQAVKEEHKELIDELERKFQSLNLLSVQTDLKLVKDLMSELIHLIDITSKGNHSIKNQLTEMEKKIETNCSISQKELNSVKATLQEDQVQLFGAIEQKFAELDILSVRADFIDVKNLIQDVKCAVENLNSSTDNIYEKFQQQIEILETKFLHKEAVNANELKELQTEITLLGENGKVLLDRIYAKLNNLDLIESLETKISVGYKVITDKLDLLLDKIMNYQSLTKEEKNSRNELLKQLYINGSVSIVVGNKVLGEGAFGKVSLAKYENKYVAVKALKKTTDKKILEALENEVLLMNYLSIPTSNPNILQCFGMYEEPDNLHIVLDYAKYGSLPVILTEQSFQLPVRLKVSWLCDLISAIKFIHSKNVKHRDIKAENLLLFADLNVKLSDFGLSKQHSSKQSSSMMAGTMNFMPPEVLAGKGSAFASDIYSWGLTFYQIVMRQSPNRFAVATSQLIEEVLKEIEDRSKEENYIYDRSHFERFKWSCLMMCVDEDPMKRPSASNVLAMLSESLEKLGGDPRFWSQKEDKEMVRNLENNIDDFINGRTEGKFQKLYPSKPPQISGLTTPRLSSAGNDDINNTNNINLQVLSSDEAIQLLIDLGCVANLKKRIIEQGMLEIVNGEYLLEIDSIEYLQLFEKESLKLREPILKGILKKLQACQSNGLAREKYDELKNKVGISYANANSTRKAETKILQEIEDRRLFCDFACERTLLGHSGFVISLIQLSDGRIASGSWDRKIKIWNLGNVSCELTLEGHNHCVDALIELEDGRIASGSSDSTIKFWNVVNGLCEQTLSGHSAGIDDLVHLGDGKIASGSADKKIKIWYVANGSHGWTLSGHSSPVSALTPLKNGNIASGSYDKTIKIWNVGYLSCERTLTGHSRSVNALIQLQDGRIVSGSADKTIKIWNEVNGLCEFTFFGHRGCVNALIQLGDGRIASGSYDKTIKIWNVGNGFCELTLAGHTESVDALIQLDDGKIASGSVDNTIKLWTPVF